MSIAIANPAMRQTALELDGKAWNLRMNDNANGDIGRIDSWSITF